MKKTIVPLDIQGQIALKIADPKRICQMVAPENKFKSNTWHKFDHCVLNCGQPKGKSSIHSGTGAFFTKCCSKKGSNVIEFLMEKDKSTIEVAIDTISKLMGISVCEVPQTTRGMFQLLKSQSFLTSDGELVKLLGHYEYDLTLLFETGKKVSTEKMLTVQQCRYETRELINVNDFFSHFFRPALNFFDELFENAASNGLVDSGVGITVNDEFFIDIEKLNDWLSALAKKGGK